MKDREIKVFERLVSAGFRPAELRRRVNWPSVRLGTDECSVDDAVLGVAVDLARGGGAAVAGGVLADVGEDLAGDLAKEAVKILVPRPAAVPPLPQGFTTKLSLINCNLVFVGMVGDGDYMKIEVSNNGDTLPFDTPGVVQITTDPPLPTPPGGGQSNNSVNGDGSVAVVGPRTVWLHLTGEEDGCDVDITIFPS